MHNEKGGHYKYVFVCGLQRSGTSVLGRNIARFENCTGFKNTGVLMDEGQFLQDVYPIDGEFGGAGRFGFDPRAHRTEASKLLTPENVAKLRASWHAYWDPSKSICVEKTPANLLMTRFLQAAFPNSYFVVIMRHPVPVSMASQRWKVSVSPIYRLFEHWLHCHKLFEQDKKHLKRVYELRYEDYIENPDKYHQEIAAFIGTSVPERPKEDKFYYVTQWRNPVGVRVPEHAMESTSRAHNEKYFNSWCDLSKNSPFKHYYRYITAKYEPEFAKYGYSLTKGLSLKQEGVSEPWGTSMAVGPLYCFMACVSASAVRFTTRSKGYIKSQIRARLPQPVKVRIKQFLQRVTPGRKQPEVVSS
jgi:hypothetical protein